MAPLPPSSATGKAAAASITPFSAIVPALLRLAVTVALVSTVCTGGATVASSALPPYRNASLPIPARVRDLLSRMTLDEKVAQLLQPWETATPEDVFDQL